MTFVIQVIREKELPMLYDCSYYSIGFIAKQELDMNEDEFLSYVTGGESGACDLFKKYKMIVRFYIDSESEESKKWTEHEYIIDLVDYNQGEINFLNEKLGDS